MATKSKNKAASALLCAFMLYLGTIAVFAAADVMKHTKYIDKSYYFSSAAFAEEIGLFSKLLLTYHIQLKDYRSLSPEDKINPDQYNDLKAKYDANLRAKKNGIVQNFAGKIEQAQLSGDPSAVSQWTGERDRQIAAMQKESDQALGESIQKLAASRDANYAELKRSLDIRSDSIKYYFRNTKTGESYSNLGAVPSSLEELKGTTIYSEALTRIPFPFITNPNPQLQGLSQLFARNQLEGMLIIPKDPTGGSKFQSDYTYFLQIRDRVLKELLLGAACLAAGIGIWIYLRKKSRLEELLAAPCAWVKRRVPVDVRAAVCLVVFLIPFLYSLESPIFYFPLDGSQVVRLTVDAVLLGLLLLHLAGAIRLLQPANRGVLQEEWRLSLIRSLYPLGQESWSNKSLLFKLFILLMLTGMLGLLFGLMIEDSPPNEFAVITCLFATAYLFIVVPLLLKFIVTLNRILLGTQQLAAGNFEAGLSTKGNSQLAQLAHHINHMRHGFQQALEDRTRSERMKTELITNVSHDLKTPLTSIINYVNLLKRESLTPEEARQYIDVLDRKTDRLKVLIDDLFEASRMASGAVELNYERVDVVALMHQALAEFSEKIEEASLTFRINASEPHLFARLDGKKTWRLFENLISNTVKYALPGTRVYVTIAGQQEFIEIRMQNVSAYEIDFEVAELFERFKRGDKSRQTEGSGLGLAIAKSIVELQGGELRIEIDGDQFKVLIRFGHYGAQES